jgi:hypothetical protein
MCGIIAHISAKLSRRYNMAYVLGGGNNESDGFERAIANFAIRAVHESTGLVNTTTVVTPSQGK